MDLGHPACCGKLCDRSNSFVAGYSGGTPSRAAGFAMTFFPSVLMLILIIHKVALTR
ncbi:MAG: hypothetical protein P8N03_02050 [Arenicellales bacterium]|nr:hypothetical protein [Arenicellales bacterium]